MTAPDTLQQRVRDAFDQIHVPHEVNQATLDAIKSYSEQTPVPPKRKPRAKLTLYKWFAFAACLAAALLFGGYGVWTHPTALLDIDVNPSLSLKVNCLNYVIEAEPLNEDAAEVVAQTPLVGMPCDQALETLANSSALSLYIDNDALADISVASDSEAQSNQLYEWARDIFSSCFAEVVQTQVTFDEMETAHGHGMGAGKYRAACQLMNLDEDATLESCAKMSMSELHECINKCQHKQIESGASQQSEADSDSTEVARRGEAKMHSEGHGHKGEQRKHREAN